MTEPVYRARYYNPAIDRFISEDPMGFSGGGSDLYSYVYGSPTNIIDPTGNCPWCIVAGIGAGFGGLTEGVKGYRCGDRDGKLAGDIGRGIAAGGIGALAGLGAGFFTGDPYLGGAAGSAAYDVVNTTLQGGWSSFGWNKALDMVANAEMGAVTGGLAEMLGPTVRGGWNFNPFLSPRTLGPKAMQEYSRDAIGGILGLGPGLAPSGGRGNCGCH